MDWIKLWYCKKICYYIQFNKHEKLNQEHIIKLDGLPYLIDLANNIHIKVDMLIYAIYIDIIVHLLLIVED